MTTTDFPNFRALCAELVNELHGYKALHPEHATDLIDLACRELATPPPEQKSSIDELIAGCKPLDPEMAEALTTEARWRLFGEDGSATPPPEPPTDEEYPQQVNRMCQIILGHNFGNKELDALALCVGHHDFILNPHVATPPPEPQEAMIPDQYKGHQLHVYRAGFHAGYKHGLTQAPAALTQPAPPTDEELLTMRSWSSHSHTFDSDLVDFARAVLERWGRPATPPPEAPADGEVVELVRWMRLESEDWRQANPRGYQGARLTRAAELLERTATPPPEPPKRPTEQEVADMAEELTWKRLPQDDESTDSFLLDVVNAALERWGK